MYTIKQECFSCADMLPVKVLVYILYISVVQVYFTAGHQKLKIYSVGRHLNFRTAI